MNQAIYLDHAATTAIRPEVIVAMTQAMTEHYGNPSSTHAFGRQAKSAIELARKSIAQALHVSGQEIIFTSGGTEGNNWIIQSAICDLKVTRIITSRIEHHAVLHSVLAVQEKYGVVVDYVNILPNGAVDMTHLVTLLSENQKTLVSLMHVNNETGVITNIQHVAQICKEHQAYFHSDTVQSVGKMALNLQDIQADFIVGTAHKFHGPKGIGFVFVRKGLVLQPLFFGGEQEKGWRAGTESVPQIVGMAKALTWAMQHLEQEQAYIGLLKNQVIFELKNHFPNLKINGENTINSILNISLPLFEKKYDMLLFQLDMKKIAVSRGSACQSGSSKPSHVLKEMLTELELQQPHLRISLGYENKPSEMSTFVNELKNICHV